MNRKCGFRRRHSATRVWLGCTARRLEGAGWTRRRRIRKRSGDRPRSGPRDCRLACFARRRRQSGRPGSRDRRGPRCGPRGLGGSHDRARCCYWVRIARPNPVTRQQTFSFRGAGGGFARSHDRTRCCCWVRIARPNPRTRRQSYSFRGAGTRHNRLAESVGWAILSRRRMRGLDDTRPNRRRRRMSYWERSDDEPGCEGEAVKSASQNSA